MTCGCTVNGLGSAGPMLGGSRPYMIGLGQIDPVTIATSVSEAIDAWQSFLNALGIGAGAREADVIVPVQNQVVANVIAPVSAYLTTINNGTHVPTCQELSTWLGEVKQAQTTWLNFLHNTQWQDGRAAQQGEATLAPYFTNATNDLNKYIAQYCGSGGITGIFTDPATGQLNYTTIAMVGVAAYLLLKK